MLLVTIKIKYLKTLLDELKSTSWHAKNTFLLAMAIWGKGSREHKENIRYDGSKAYGLIEYDYLL